MLLWGFTSYLHIYGGGKVIKKVRIILHVDFIANAAVCVLNDASDCKSTLLKMATRKQTGLLLA